ncbi:ISAs1 family transposase [Maricaulis sp.]|uniref:ISAs1 family transposase n=1 Tax=Maricaulis sp. TaxID=1486257 RepID=UPI00329A1791
MFSELPDPRAANARHRLCDLLLIALAASLCGAQGATDYAQFARSKQALLEEVIGPFDPPSHDTFSRVFRLLEPAAFAEAFAAFARGFAGALEGVVAIDGKAMRRAYDAGGRAWPPIVVSAWAADMRLVLGCLTAGPAGDGEAETAIRLIGLLDLDGATVTADALHCHRRMAAAIRAKGGDYALSLKGNRPSLKREASALLDAAGDEADRAATDEMAHGRREQRRAVVVAAGAMAQRHDFEGLAAVASVTSQRDDAPPQTRLFLLSRPMGAAEVLTTVRAHWSVENTLHWGLDVTFAEDGSRARKDHAPANIALITRLAMSLLQRIDDPKTSIRRRMKRCAWENDYLLNAIAHMR